jgi:clathrin heavy chain
MFLLQSLMMNNPNGAVALAKMVAKQTPPPVDVNVMADLFLQVCVCVCVCVFGGEGVG